MPMQSTAAAAIASSMLRGASRTCRPRSCAKNEKNGILIPEWSTTPADATSSRPNASHRPSSAAPTMIIDLVTKPENNGTAEIDNEPTMQKAAVQGIDL